MFNKINPFLTEINRIEYELKNMPQQAADLMREISSINRELRSFSKNARTSQELKQKQNLILRRNKIEDELRQQPERRHELEKDHAAYRKASDCFLRTFHDANVHSKVEIITNNFVVDNIRPCLENKSCTN